MFNAIPPRILRKTRRCRLLSQNMGRCFFCDCPNAQTLDHLIPKAKGGTEHDANLVPCCAAHNASKGHQDALIWLRRQSFYSADKEAQVSDRLAWAKEWIV